MIPSLNKSIVSRSLQICLNTLVFLSTSRNDTMIHSVNNIYNLSEPVIEINIEKEMDLTNIMPDVYILDLDYIKLNDFISAYYKRIFFNPRAEYIITGSYIPPQTSVILEGRFILNVVFMNTVSGMLFTYFPYSWRMFGHIDERWVKIGDCNTLTSEGNSFDLFPDKIPKVWTNSSISVMNSIAPPFWICTDCDKEGYDSDFYHLAFSFLNLTEIITVVEAFDEDWQLESMKSLREKKYDIILGEEPDWALDSTYPHIEFFWILVVPAPIEMPRWKYILTLFSEQVWLAWFFSCVCLYLASVLLDSVSKIFSFSIFFKKVALIFNLSIGQPYNLSPNIFSEGFLFVSITFFTTIMSFFYTGRFPFFLVGINFEKSISTVEDIMNEKLMIGTTRYELSKEYFSKSTKISDYYEKHNMWCDYSTECLDQLIAGRNMSFFITSPQLDYWQQFYLDDMGRSLYNRIEPPFIRQLFGSNLIKGHPVTKRLSTFLLHMDQHGFKDKIMSKYNKKILEYMQNLETKSLTIEYIIAPLFIWALGVCCSILVFSCEKTN